MVPGSSPGGPTKVNKINMSINSYKFRLRIFIFFSIFLLLEGFFYFYSARLSYFCFKTFQFSKYCDGVITQHKYNFFDLWKNGYNPIIWNENGIIETLQILLLLITIFHFTKIIIFIKKKINIFFCYFLYFYLICIIYYFLEEISWGQHYFQWESSEFFLKNNNQKETNIHNISNLFDQLPRSLLLIWCGFPFVIQKFFLKINANEVYSKFVFPQKELKYLSHILILFFLPDFIIDKMNLHPGNNINTIGVNKSDIYNFFTFQFIRLSEYLELIFTFYLYNHSLFFKKIIYFKT